MEEGREQSGPKQRFVQKNGKNIAAAVSSLILFNSRDVTPAPGAGPASKVRGGRFQ